MFIAIAILVIALIIGIPVPFSFFAASIYMIFALDYDPSFLLPYGFSQMSSTLLLAIPLFILAGNIIEKGGMGEKIVALVEVVLGRLKGGLGIVTIVSCAVFGAISGSAAATMTTIGTILLPRLEKAGYPQGLSASLVASSCVLGMLIPPSSLMILYAWISNQSVLAAFLATIIPGIILIISLSAVNVFYLRNVDIKTTAPVDIKTKTKQFGGATKGAFPSIILAVIILGGIYGGFMTTTEAAGVAVIYTLVIGFGVHKGLTKKNISNVIIKAGMTTGVIMVMIYGSMMLSRMFTMEHLPDKMTDMLLSISENKIILLLMINGFLIIIGMLMDDTSGVLLSTPIILPIAMNFGVDPIHFAAILSVNLGLGYVTPPAAPMLYLAGNMAGARTKELFKPTALMIVFAWVPTLLLTTYIPDLSLFLPKLILGY